MGSPTPSFTTEALVALAVRYDYKPPVFWLLQLGFDPNSEQIEADYYSIIERGSRTLAALRPYIDLNDDMRQSLRDYIGAMSDSPVYVSLRRSDRSDLTALYCGDLLIVDAVDVYGNHSLRDAASLDAELKEFVGDYDGDDQHELEIGRDRYLRNVGPAADEDEWIAHLMDDHSVQYVVSVSHTHGGDIDILQWRSAQGRLYRLLMDDATVTAQSTSTARVVDAIIEASAPR